MSMVFSRDGFRVLRLLIIVALAGIAVALFVVAGSYWYWQLETRNDEQSLRAQREADSRVNNARRELNDLRDSAQNFQTLTARGMFLAEQRLDLVEAMKALKDRHKLLDMQYTVQAQRPLKIASGDYAAVDVRASRIKLNVRALHDGDLVAFLDEFPRLQRGYFPLDRCVVWRMDRVTAATTATATRAEPSEIVESPTPNTLFAECSLEWITLQDKRNPTVVQASAGKPL